MEVLVVESEPRAAVIAIVQLEASGHEVKRCHDPDGRAGLSLRRPRSAGDCPLEDGEVDVGLTVRGRIPPAADPARGRCHLRAAAARARRGRRPDDAEPVRGFRAVVADQDVVGRL